MFERFTEYSRQVVIAAQQNARDLGHSSIDTEHELLGLLDDVRPGAAGHVLNSLGITADETRERVVEIVPRSDGPTVGQLPFTPRAKKVLELAVGEADSLGHNQIRPEHLLLGLIAEDDGVAMRVLHSFGADAQTIRDAVLPVLPGPDPHPPRRPPSAARGMQPDVAFTVVPNPPVRKLLMAAGARALSEERTEFGVNDLLGALADEAASALAALGVDVQAMREGIERHGTPEQPAG